MPFFDDVDSMGIVEQHIQEAVRLEDDEARRMLERYKEVRQELRDRLSRVRADSFTAQQIRGVLAQVTGAIAAMTASLKDNLGASALSAAELGIENLMREISKFEEYFTGAVTPINLNAQVAALDTRNFLLNQYETSLDAYGQDLISQLTTNITQAALMEMPYSSLITRLDQFFMGEEWKLHRIARTELHNIYNLGKMRGMDRTQEAAIPDLMKALVHPMDSRTGADSVYADQLQLVAEIDEPFQYVWRGKLRVFMAPPDRPNDRGILIPYRKAWAEE